MSVQPCPFCDPVNLQNWTSSQKVVRAASRREAAGYLQTAWSISQYRAGAAIGISNSSLRYQSRRPPDLAPRRRLRELAVERPRSGYERLTVMLRREGTVVNHKRVYRRYREEGLKLRERRRSRSASAARVPLSPPTRAGERYSMDFMRDTLSDGRVSRTLDIVDDYTRECLAMEVDTSLPGQRAARVLERLAEVGRVPRTIVLDDGAEFTGKAVDQWANRRGVQLRFIDPGKPMQNAYVESFNGKFRDGCVNQHWFASLAEARLTIEDWRVDYTELRPHQGLARRTPAEFARRWEAYEAAKLSL